MTKLIFLAILLSSCWNEKKILRIACAGRRQAQSSLFTKTDLFYKMLLNNKGPRYSSYFNRKNQNKQ